jgi:hypothetical protein
MAPAVPFLGGFGFGAVVVLSIFWPGWPLEFWPGLPFGALFAGIVYRRNRLPAYLGFAAAGTAFWVLGMALYPFQCRAMEYCGVGDVLVPLLYVGLLLLAAVAVALPGFLAPGTLPFDRLLRRSAATVGVIALAFAALTAGLTVVQLAQGPFQVSLPAGWNVVDPRYAQRDTEYGEDYTAALGSVRPFELNPPTVPVLGITVVRAGLAEHPTASECLRSAYGWPSSMSRLYAVPIAQSGEVTLPGGAAYRAVQLPDDGSRLYSWSLARSRLVGALPLDLCYILVVTVPPDSEMTEADATALVSLIRFP